MRAKFQFMRKLAILTLSLCGCAHNFRADIKHTTSYVAIVSNDEPAGFVFISDKGAHIEMDAEECAADIECVSMVKQLTDLGHFDTVHVTRERETF